MDWQELKSLQSRRSFLRDTAAGLGTVAFWHLLQAEGLAGDASQTSNKD